MDAKRRKRELVLGVVLLIGFLVVLVGIFSPIFNGHNGMQYMDNLYNSISKGSAYYMPEMEQLAQQLKGEKIEATLNFNNEKQAERVAVLFNANGAEAEANQGAVTVRGDIGDLYTGAMADAEAMYNNNEEAVESRYGYDGRAALYNWWSASKVLDKTLSKQKRFDVAQKITTIKSKALETAYNYYGIEPHDITDEAWIVAGSLIFYVIYTLWYGFAILFMFEGSGFRLEH